MDNIIPRELRRNIASFPPSDGQVPEILTIDDLLEEAGELGLDPRQILWDAIVRERERQIRSGEILNDPFNAIARILINAYKAGIYLDEPGEMNIYTSYDSNYQEIGNTLSILGIDYEEFHGDRGEGVQYSFRPLDPSDSFNKLADAIQELRPNAYAEATDGQLRMDL